MSGVPAICSAARLLRTVLARPGQPEAPRLGIDVEADAVVAHPHEDLRVDLGDADLHVLGAGVPGRVRQALFDEPVDRGLDLGRQPRSALRVGQGEIRLDRRRAPRAVPRN
jgi:hypothetical protein